MHSTFGVPQAKAQKKQKKTKKHEDNTLLQNNKDLSVNRGDGRETKGEREKRDAGSRESERETKTERQTDRRERERDLERETQTIISQEL